MIDLRGIALVAIDTVCHDLTRLAILDCMRDIDFEQVLVFSDQDLGIAGTCPRPCTVQNNYEAEFFMWRGVHPHLAPAVSHVLMIQWDGWIINPSLWSETFRQYDYLGAPWTWHPPSHRVGNGGFTLRSKNLLLSVAEHPDLFGFSKPEDVALCHIHRPELERRGLRWAPEGLARQFSFEWGDQGGPWPSFGYHGMWNWPLVLDEATCLARLDMLSDYHFRKEEFDRLILFAKMLGKTTIATKCTALQQRSS